MATLAFVAVAAANTTAGTVAGAVAIAAAASVGSYIDQSFLIPALTGTPESKGRRADSIRIQTADEGQPVPWLHGPRVRISGNLIWAGEPYETSKKVSSGGGKRGGSSTRVYTYYSSIAVGLGEPPTDAGILSIQKVFANGKVLYDVAGETDSHRFDDFVLFNGANTQNPSAFQEAEEGVGEVPSYRGTAYAEIQGLNLTDFGTAIPQLSFIVEAEASLTLKTLLERLLDRAGYAASEYDVDASLTQAIEGFVVEPGGLRGALEELMMFFDLAARETNGVLEIYPLTNPTSKTVAAADVMGPMGLMDKKDEESLTAEVVVNYVNSTAEYSAGSGSFRSQSVTNRVVDTVDLNLTLTPTEARSFAARRWARLWSEQRSATIKLPPTFFTTQEGDLHSYTQSGVTYLLRCDEVSLGYNGVVEISYTVLSTTGRTTAPAYDYLELEGQASNAEHPAQYSPPDMNFEVLQLPPLTDGEQEANTPGLYLAQSTDTPGVPFLGTDFYFSPTEDGTYTQQFFTSLQATMGEVNVQLDSDVGVITHVTNTGSFRVTLAAGTLESVTEDLVLAGQNVALVGDEIIGFTTATLIAGTTYELSGLIRGLRNTTPATHAVLTRFVLLSEDSVLWQPYDQGLVGTTQWAKLVPVGLTVDDVAAVAVALTGENLKPWNPWLVEGAVDENDHWIITWKRRTRRNWNPLGEAAVPVDDQPESYEIDIMDGANVVRTISVSQATTAQYLASQQTADFGGLQSTITIKVYQISAVMGRSVATEETL